MTRQTVFSVKDDGSSAITFSEDDAAGQALVAARKKVSTTFTAFAAVMRMAQIDEACEALNRRERELAARDSNHKRLKFDPNEVRRTYQTIVEAAQKAEYLAEKEKRPHTIERSFRCAAHVMELFYRHEQMPEHLAPKMAALPPALRAEKQKLINKYARSWQRRYKLLHLVQCFTHFALVDKEKEVDTPERQSARLYKERIADLMYETATAAAQGRGLTLPRYHQAAKTALKNFIASEKNIYAPDWSPDLPEVEEGPEEESQPKQPTGAARWKAIKAAVTEKATEAKRFALEARLPFDLARQELYDIITEAFSVEPEPPGEGESGDSVSSVITNGDTTFSTGGQSAGFAPSASSESANFLSKNEESRELATTNLSRLNLPPEDEARAMISACESVGATMFKTAFTAIYPLSGDAAPLPATERSEPREKGVNMSAAALMARIPDYLKRNQERQHNVAVRVWGPIIQVDDCSREFYERLKPLCFAAVQTSPKSFQAWLALSSAFVGPDGKRNDALTAIRDRFFKRCEELKESANGGAYNSIRMPGTLNIKEKYLPDFPRIRLLHVSMGRITSPEELDAVGLLAPAPAPALRLVKTAPRTRNIGASALPHGYFVQRAPLKEDGQPNMSRADMAFAVHRLALGDSRWEVAAELRAVRDKAARRDDYVERTLDAAEDYLARQPAQGRERIAV